MNGGLLAIVKTLLKITDDEQDALLEIFIDMTVQSVLNYCNISALPAELRYVVCNMVVGMYKDMVGESNAPISSISEAGSSVSFATNMLQSRIDDSIKNMTQLNRFRQPYRT